MCLRRRNQNIFTVFDQIGDILNIFFMEFVGLGENFTKQTYVKV